MNSTIKVNVNGNRKEKDGLRKISKLRTRIESLEVKTWSLEIRTRSPRIKTWSFCEDKAKISNKAREEESHKNIPSRIDLYKRRLDPCLSVMDFPRFLEHMYMVNYTKSRSLSCKDWSLWDRRHLKLKVAIFIWIAKGPEFVFGPKLVFSLIFQLEIGCWIKLI